MKKYLLLTSMFSNDMKEAYDKIIKLNEEAGHKFTVLSPISIIPGKKDKYLETIAAALNMKDLIEEAEKYDRDLIYIGPAIATVEFDCVYTVDAKTILNQEKMLESFVKGNEMEVLLSKFHRSNRSDEDFDTVEDFFERMSEGV